MKINGLLKGLQPHSLRALVAGVEFVKFQSTKKHVGVIPASEYSELCSRASAPEVARFVPTPELVAEAFELANIKTMGRDARVSARVKRYVSNHMAKLHPGRE